MPAGSSTAPNYAFKLTDAQSARPGVESGAEPGSPPCIGLVGELTGPASSFTYPLIGGAVVTAVAVDTSTPSQITAHNRRTRNANQL
jgi:hypothetical protein